MLYFSPNFIKASLIGISVVAASGCDNSSPNPTNTAPPSQVSGATAVETSPPVPISTVVETSAAQSSSQEPRKLREEFWFSQDFTPSDKIEETVSGAIPSGKIEIITINFSQKDTDNIPSPIGRRLSQTSCYWTIKSFTVNEEGADLSVANIGKLADAATVYTEQKINLDYNFTGFSGHTIYYASANYADGVESDKDRIKVQYNPVAENAQPVAFDKDGEYTKPAINILGKTFRYNQEGEMWKFLGSDRVIIGRAGRGK